MTDVLVRWTCAFDDELTAYLLGPWYNLVNIDNVPGFAIAWGILAFWYFILYYKLDPRWFNSIDGFIDTRRSLLFAVVLYYVTVVLITIVIHKPMCQIKRKMAKRWQAGAIRPPSWLRDDIEELNTELAEKRNEI